MEWKEIAVVVFQTSSLILLCVVWFMIGKYRALCRKVRAPETSDKDGIFFSAQVGSVKKAVKAEIPEGLNPETASAIIRGCMDFINGK